MSGELRLNNQSLGATVAEPAAIVAELKRIFAERELNGETERTVFIKGPKSLDYGTVATVVDAVRMAGSFPVGLQIDNLN
jgi:biopolymer transport protein ExbD